MKKIVRRAAPTELCINSEHAIVKRAKKQADIIRKKHQTPKYTPIVIAISTFPKEVNEIKVALEKFKGCILETLIISNTIKRTDNETDKKSATLIFEQKVLALPLGVDLKSAYIFPFALSFPCSDEKIPHNKIRIAV